MEWRNAMVDEKTKTGNKDEREVVSEDSDRAIRHKRLRMLCMLNLFNIVIAIAAAVTCFCGSKLESGCAWLVAALAWSNVYDARVFSYRLHEVADESRSLSKRCLDLVSMICAGMAFSVIKAEEESGGDKEHGKEDRNDVE